MRRRLSPESERSSSVNDSTNAPTRAFAVHTCPSECGTEWPSAGSSPAIRSRSSNLSSSTAFAMRAQIATDSVMSGREAIRVSAGRTGRTGTATPSTSNSSPPR